MTMNIYVPHIGAWDSSPCLRELKFRGGCAYSVAKASIRILPNPTPFLLLLWLLKVLSQRVHLRQERHHHPETCEVLGLTLDLLHQKNSSGGAQPCAFEEALQVFLVPEPGKHTWAAPGPCTGGSSSREAIRPFLRQTVLKTPSTGSHLFGHLIWIQLPSLSYDPLMGKLMKSLTMPSRAQEERTPMALRHQQASTTPRILSVTFRMESKLHGPKSYSFIRRVTDL